MNYKHFFKQLFSWKVLLANLTAFLVIVFFWNKIFDWIEDYTYHGQSIEMPNLEGLSLEQAIKKIQESDLNYEVDSLKFDENKPPFTILRIYPAAGKKVKKGRTVYIKVNPKNRAPVVLPDVIDKSLRIAILKIQSSGLKVNDTIYVPDLARDAVIKVLYKGREVKAGMLLPRNAKLQIVAGSGNEKSEEMAPNLLGYSLEEVALETKRHKIVISDTIYVGLIEDSASVKVFYQFPRPDRAIGEERNVEIYVSNLPRSSLSNYINLLDKKYKDKDVLKNDSIVDETELEFKPNKKVEEFENISADDYKKVELEKKPTPKEDSLLKEFLKKNN